MKKALLIFLGLTVAACGSKYTPLNTTYDSQETARLMQEGSNTVRGSSILRLRDGRVVTCAGLHVYLIPATPYSSERIGILYGNTEAAYVPYKGFIEGRKPFEKASEYDMHQKKVQCDVDGRFKFNSVADGSFFVVSPITPVCNDSGEDCQGGMSMRRITLSSGQIEDVSLTQPQPTAITHDIF